MGLQADLESERCGKLISDVLHRARLSDNPDIHSFCKMYLYPAYLRIMSDVWKDVDLSLRDAFEESK